MGGGEPRTAHGWIWKKKTTAKHATSTSSCSRTVPPATACPAQITEMRLTIAAATAAAAARKKEVIASPQEEAAGEAISDHTHHA